ncbi:MAG: pyruvate kinase, partial [Desulfobacterales bacterium]|nr:pyruvate kinase [Desulfobacterales bacterium]
EIDSLDVHCRVLNGGRLYSRKGINVPRTKLSVQTLTEKDIADLKYIADTDIDLVAISFVRSPEDIAQARGVIGKTRPRVPVIAKLELPEVLENLDAIFDVSDGVMIARGDLAVEVPFERVPHLQKQILGHARARGKWAIVATQMLGSMVLNPRPTRAEVSDVANAMLDGADAMMLSEETAAGSQPKEAVEAMARIADETEKMLTPPLPEEVEVDAKTFAAGAAQAAVGAADRLHAKAIITLAGSGTTALAVSKWQPKMPIIALSAKASTLRRLNVLRGVVPVRLEGIMTMEEQLQVSDKFLVESGWAQPGDVTVAVAAIPLGSSKDTNTLRFHHVRPIAD